MSMNIGFEAMREIIVVKTGDREEQYISFNAWQTPTKVTKHILAQEDPIQAYIDWAMEGQETEKVPVYADDDIFGERDPIGFEDFNYGQGHVDDLKRWITMAEANGYEVKAVMT